MTSCLIHFKFSHFKLIVNFKFQIENFRIMLSVMRSHGREAFHIAVKAAGNQSWSIWK